MALIHHAPLILASGSTIRQQMLKSFGLQFSVEVSGVDEAALSSGLAGMKVPAQALALARAKALSVSNNHRDAYVIGADQMCEINGEILGKPGSYDNAQAQLAKLAGRTHHQHSGVVLARGGEVIWEHSAQAALTMRALTAEEIHAYVAAEAPLSSCGSYKFEALGRHLFSAAEGDHDVIKGLPVLPLLAKLHALGVLSLGEAA